MRDCYVCSDGGVWVGAGKVVVYVRDGVWVEGYVEGSRRNIA